MSYSVRDLIKKLGEFDPTRTVYMQNQDVHLVEPIYTVCETTHPIKGECCILLHNGEQEFERPYQAVSTRENPVTVAKLIRALERYDGELEVMMRPRSEYRLFEIPECTELYSAGSCGVTQVQLVG